MMVSLVQINHGHQDSTAYAYQICSFVAVNFKFMIPWSMLLCSVLYVPAIYQTDSHIPQDFCVTVLFSVLLYALSVLLYSSVLLCCSLLYILLSISLSIYLSKIIVLHKWIRIEPHVHTLYPILNTFLCALPFSHLLLSSVSLILPSSVACQSYDLASQLLLPSLTLHHPSINNQVLWKYFK